MTIGGRFVRIGLLVALAAVLAGCKTTPPEEGGDGPDGPPTVPTEEPTGPHAALVKLFPRARDIADWKLADAVQVFGPVARPAEGVEPLSADVGSEGAAQYQAYEYRRSGTASYTRAQAGEKLDMRIFEMGSPTEAFGIFSIRARGTQFPTIGLAARMTSRTLGFVKGNMFVLLEYTGLREPKPILFEFADYVADRVRETGLKPMIVQNFPAGHVQGEVYYLHTFQTLAILPFWPKTNPADLARALNLGPETSVALVGYPTTQPGEMNYLFAILYPTAADAQSAEARYQAYLDLAAPMSPAEANVAITTAGRSYLVGTLNAEENSIDDRLGRLVDKLGS